MGMKVTNWNSLGLSKDKSSSGLYRNWVFLRNPLTPNDLQRCRAVSPLKIKIPGKSMRENPTNIPIIHSVY
jgi:hypothetical protein